MRKTLSTAEKKLLRAKSYSLKPVVIIGQRGISDAVLSEIETALEAHELMKVRFGGAGREERTKMTCRIAETVGAEVVHQIGRVAVFFRLGNQQGKNRLPILSSRISKRE